jgi:hypothetical protein
VRRSELVPPDPPAVPITTLVASSSSAASHIIIDHYCPVKMQTNSIGWRMRRYRIWCPLMKAQSGSASFRIL